MHKCDCKSITYTSLCTVPSATKRRKLYHRDPAYSVPRQTEWSKSHRSVVTRLGDASRDCREGKDSKSGDDNSEPSGEDNKPSGDGDDDKPGGYGDDEPGGNSDGRDDNEPGG